MKIYSKNERILSIYTRLLNDEIINKHREAEKFKVDHRTIQRDIDDIRNFLYNNIQNGIYENIVYDRKLKGYRIDRRFAKSKMSPAEVLAVCKILIDSRALNKKEMSCIINKLCHNCISKDNRMHVEELIKNEFFHYIELRHRKNLINDIWQIGQAVEKRNYMEIEYFRIKDRKFVKRKIKPVGIMFNEYYFYLTGYIEDKDLEKKIKRSGTKFPTIYRIDRIRKYKILNEHFSIPYADKFEEGEFRKRIQFMFAGDLKNVKFRYTGNDIDSILDRLPTAKITGKDEKGYIIQAEAFGNGIEMWLRSQGSLVEIL